jgi:hypothetical protein
MWHRQQLVVPQVLSRLVLERLVLLLVLLEQLVLLVLEQASA